MRKPGWYWVKWDDSDLWQCAQWDNGGWWMAGDDMHIGNELVVGPRIPTPDDVSWHEPTARQIREMCDGLTGNEIRWTLDGALTASPQPETQP